MFRDLEQRDVDAFASAAQRYAVRFVVLSTDRSPDWLRLAGLRPRDLPRLDAPGLAAMPGFEVALRSDRFVIARFQPGLDAQARR